MTQNGILFELQEGGGGEGLMELTELELGGFLLYIFYFLAFTKCEEYHWWRFLLHVHLTQMSL